jgi:hypothetical protein
MLSVSPFHFLLVIDGISPAERSVQQLPPSMANNKKGLELKKSDLPN